MDSQRLSYRERHPMTACLIPSIEGEENPSLKSLFSKGFFGVSAVTLNLMPDRRK